MKVSEPSDTLLVIETSATKGRVVMAIFLAIWIFLTIKLGGRPSFPLIVINITFIAWAGKSLLFGYSKTEWRFDRGAGQLVWSKRRMGRAETETMPLDEVQKVARREMPLRNETVMYELIITSRSRNPMLVMATSDFVQFEHIVQRIKSLLGRAALTRDGLAGPLVVAETLTPEEEEKLE